MRKCQREVNGDRRRMERGFGCTLFLLDLLPFWFLVFYFFWFLFFSTSIRTMTIFMTYLAFEWNLFIV